MIELLSAGNKRTIKDLKTFGKVIIWGMGSHINEVMVLSEVTQYFKNNSNFPIELSIELSELTNCIITKFEMILDDQKIVSKILEKEKAEEKYNDAIASGNAGFISYSKDKKTTVCLGNVPSKKEVELKTHYFGNLLCNDLSYQAIFPTIFPTFIIHEMNLIKILIILNKIIIMLNKL